MCDGFYKLRFNIMILCWHQLAFPPTYAKKWLLSVECRNITYVLVPATTEITSLEDLPQDYQVLGRIRRMRINGHCRKKFCRGAK